MNEKVGEINEKLTKPERQHLIKELAARFKPYRARIIACLFLVSISTTASLSTPALIGWGVTHATKPGKLHTLIILCASIIAILIIGATCNKIQASVLSLVGERVLCRLRNELFTHIMTMPISFFDGISTGKLVARMTTDFDAIDDTIQQGLGVLTSSIFLLMFALVALPIYCWQLFLVALLSLVPLGFLSSWFKNRSELAYTQVRDRISQTLSYMQEGLSGIRVIQAFSKQDESNSKFRDRNEAQYKANLHAVAISIRYFPVLEMSGVVTTALVIGLGGSLVYWHAIGLDKVVAFILYLGILFAPIQQMSQIFNQFQSAGAALSKIMGILNERPKLRQPSLTPVDFPDKHSIEFKDVSFSYAPNTPAVLNKVNFAIDECKRVALVGPTGAGKSTIAKLITRFYDANSGDILIGGQSIYDIDVVQFRRNVIMVPQETNIFKGSLVRNIDVISRESDPIVVRDALEQLGAYEMFSNLPEGLNTELEEGGAGLSQGQKQLIALARIYLLAPKIIVLDEATSNLDSHLQRIVDEAMAKLAKGKIIITIAHRLNTAKSADHIIVVSGGSVIEQGSHAELLSNGVVYRELYRAWERNVA